MTEDEEIETAAKNYAFNIGITDNIQVNVYPVSFYQFKGAFVNGAKWALKNLVNKSFKIPDSLLLKRATKDLGKEKAYSAELEDKILKIYADNKELIKSSPLYKDLLERNKKYNQTIREQKAMIDKLINKLAMESKL